MSQQAFKLGAALVAAAVGTTVFTYVPDGGTLAGFTLKVLSGVALIGAPIFGVLKYGRA